MKHEKQFVPCRSNVVYCIPLKCGRFYVGQTGRCLNVRLREHGSSLNRVPSGHLSTHCKGCGCTPFLHDTTVLFRHGDQKARKIVEAYKIQKMSDSCVSALPLSLLDNKLVYLGESGT